MTAGYPYRVVKHQAVLQNAPMKVKHAKYQQVEGLFIMVRRSPKVDWEERSGIIKSIPGRQPSSATMTTFAIRTFFAISIAIVKFE